MDINVFMQKSLDNQKAIIKLLEQIATPTIVGILDTQMAADDAAKAAFSEKADKVIAEVKENASKMELADPTKTVAQQKAEKAEKAAKTTKVEEPAQEEEELTPPAEDVPVDESLDEGLDEVEEVKANIDEARAALKQYAQREGNEAAMDLLKELGAVSVTALSEKGPEALGKLVKVVKEALA